MDPAPEDYPPEIDRSREQPGWHLQSIADFREALSLGAGLVITDTATGVTFHSDPQGCPFVREAAFEEKVVQNRERNGSYFSLESISEARLYWPEVRGCRSTACTPPSN